VIRGEALIVANKLHYGDNLPVMRDMPSESVDLIYLDPPFNSNASYNVLFRSPTGDQSPAQIEAFEDTWQWNIHAEEAFDEVMKSRYGDAAEMLRSVRSFLGKNAMMAYLTNIAVRMLQMHRLLKPTGSLYLHCDPTASHYLKILMDAVFGKDRFRNEIVWQRTSSHNDPKRYGRISDRIFYFTKSAKRTFNVLYTPYSAEQKARFKYKDKRGAFKAENLTAPHYSETRTVEWRGTHPGADRQWRFSIDELERLYADGRILLKKNGAPRKDGLKEYLHESPGQPLQDVWTDIIMGPTSGERLGYPTQKPTALLERIVASSSNEGDVVLDPFCGCGTTIHAAQKLKRQWIGIDVTHLAIGLIRRRLVDAFGTDAAYEVLGTPKDLDGARALADHDKYQFQWWAVSLVDAVPYGGKKKGADTGIDGHIYFRADADRTEKAIVSVKGGGVGVKDIRELITVVGREKAKIGIYLSLEEPTGPMRKESAEAGFYQSPLGGRYPKIQILTIKELFDGKRPQIPLIDPSSFRRAVAEDDDEDQGELDFTAKRKSAPQQAHSKKRSQPIRKTGTAATKKKPKRR
jgi:site-specific DNA-methyltransferase (adenine-specific)